MSDETKEERQDNELAALQAIFGDAVVDNREKNPWKVWRPLDLMLTLNPLHNSDIRGVHCSVTIHFKCCLNYPCVPPTMFIIKVHGLSTENSRILLEELKSYADTLCGEVMIYQLAMRTQQFLHDHYKPTLSFYDEMLKEKNEMEQMKLHESQTKENEERQKIKDEIQRRQAMLRVAGKERVRRSSVSQESSADGQGDVPELVYYADDKMSPAKVSQTMEIPCTCAGKGVQVVKNVYIGNCLGHSINGSTTYLAIDGETGERLVVKKWIIPLVLDLPTQNRQITALQANQKAISKIKNSYLIPYTALEICDKTKEWCTIGFARHCVFLFRVFILGSSLKAIINRIKLYSDQFEGLRLLRHVGIGVLRALKELHSAGQVHSNVRSENVFIDDCGDVKLVGAALDSQLTAMVDGDSFYERQTASQDIYSTGQLLLSIVASNMPYMEIPPDLPSSAKDFFARCLTEEEQSQWSAEQLSNHVFLLDTSAKEPTTKIDDIGSSSEDGDTAKKIAQSVPATSGHSRLHAEFEILTWLGKGAFGDVLKVKNKLDGGFYAIKRIKLNPESVNLNKNITREVKLLSRLNHENVVRYHNAWIETTFEQVEQNVDTKNATELRNDSLDGVVAKLAGGGIKIEWSISENPAQADSLSDSEDDDDDEQAPTFHIVTPENESSGGIEFEQNSNNLSETVPSEDVVDSKTRSERLYQVLYIQMEFCEKNTLRQAIDKGLYQDNIRAWRLFREIVEGLAHVHQRGMIHRDLKPVNIFLDSNDHVKIGDFGLATKAFTAMPVEDKSKPQEQIDGSLTGQIGTALYVAPELLQSSTKMIYNQKVDIYSLGIILFEMFHPLTTAMERLIVLSELRSSAVKVNERFDTTEKSKQIHVVRWLLNHEPSLRPTCAELLSSEHVPRPVPEGALSGLLSHALSERGSRGYHRLITACLDQKLSTAEDYTYHNDMRSKPLDLLSGIKDVVIKIFRSHGATEFAPPLLTPRAKAWDQYPNAVKVMTASGSVCHLPHDLRLPFARHTAYSDIKYMRRYCIDRVFGERHVPGFHPKEILECAFDIVTPKTDSLWLDAELLVVASRAASACSLKVSLQVNHSELLRTLLLACGVSIDKHADIYPVLVDVSLGRITNLQLETHLTSLCITNHNISNLFRLMKDDLPVKDLKEKITPLIKDAKWAKRVTQAIHVLEAVYRNAKALGCNCPITVAPLLASSATQHSGVFWQMCVVRDEKLKAKRRSGDLIARGGRYDALVEEFWKVARTEKDQNNSELKSSSIGFSMSLERMAAILKKMDALPFPGKRDIKESTLICICVWGTAGNGRDGLAATNRAQLALDLWASGYTCEVWPAHTVDTHDFNRPCIVLMQDDNCMRVVCDDKKRVREHKVAYIDVLDFIKQQLNPDITRYPEGSNSRAMSWSECEKSNSPIISVTFITASDKMTKNAKRSCESQINSKITSSLVWLGLSPVLGVARVCAAALACDAAVVRALAAHLAAPLHPHDMQRAARHTAALYPKCQNILEEAMTELSNIVKQNNSIRSSDEIQLYALYSIPDSVCRLIT